MENEKFTCGRYNGKTFQEVYDLDKQFCSMILEDRAHNNKYAPDEFKKFLATKMRYKTDCDKEKSAFRYEQQPNKFNIKKRSYYTEREPKNNVIKERSCHYFIKALSKSQRKELEDLVGDFKINVREVHEPCNRTFQTNGFLGKFYHFFIFKTVFNLKNEVGYCKYIEYISTVFPFLVSDKVSIIDFDDIVSLFEDNESLKESMQKFLDTYFDDIEFLEILKLFLSNIYYFQKNNFTDEEVKQLEIKVNYLLRPKNSDGLGKETNSNLQKSFVNDYLKSFPRLNDEGCKRYKHFYECFNDVSENLFDKSTDYREYDYDYFFHLPEINLYEIFTLLKPDSFIKDTLAYIKNLKKYLYFFIKSLQSEFQPVFFIDELLFETLKSYEKFKYSREDIFDLFYTFAMMTLIYRRKQPSDRRNVDYKISESNLEHVKDYIEHFPNINTAIVNYEIISDVLESSVLLCTEDAIVDTCYSVCQKNAASDFYESIICASICEEKNIKRIVIYNAYLGQETSVDMPQVKEEVKAFVRKYNKYDFTEKLPAIKFLVWGYENCFLEDTIPK